MTALLATPEQLRLWLGLLADAEEELPTLAATNVIEGVSQLVCDYTGRPSIISEERTVRLTGSGSSELLLPGAPVTAVDEVILNPDSLDEGDPEDITDSVEWSEDGILEYRGYRWPLRRRYISVTFTSGFVACPPSIRNLVLRVSARAISNPEGLVQELVEGYQAGFSFDATRLPTLSPPDERELWPYRL